MAVTTEIAPNIYRISIFAQWGNLQFNHFLVKDDEPLLFHTGLRGMHAEIREAVSKLINLSKLRHISFSHFESDECRSLNEWLAAAPKADVILKPRWSPLVSVMSGRRGLPGAPTIQFSGDSKPLPKSRCVLPSRITRSTPPWCSTLKTRSRPL
jgi:ODP family beta-lactamase